MKNIFKTILILMGLSLALVACGGQGEEQSENQTTEQSEDKLAEQSEESEEETGDQEVGAGINVVSREDGSGTRAAFVEIVGVVDENDNDITFEDAAIQSSTDAAMSTVAQDPSAIGYISLGSLNDTVKAVKIDGSEPSVEAIQKGEYKISRPFNIAYHAENLSDLSKDLIDFIESKEGQEIVVNEGYITINEDAPAYEGKDKDLKGDITIGGSTSVSPVMEKLTEAYKAIHPDVNISINPTGSGAGIKGAIDGSLDIGMASRELKDDELTELDAMAIALDGIAVIVNPGNTVEDMSLDNAKEIYLGNLRSWEEVGK